MVTASSANAGASARQGAADNEAQQIEHGIGAAVEAFRLEKGWSRHKLAMEADLDRSAVFKIEKGQRTPTPGTIAQLATAFGVTITQLSAAAYVAAAEDQAERRNRAAARASILAAVGAAGGLAAVPVLPGLLGIVAATKVIEGTRRQRSSPPDDLRTRDALVQEIVDRLAALDATELEALLATLPERNEQMRTTSCR